MSTHSSARRRRAWAAVLFGASVLQGFVRLPHTRDYREQAWHGDRDRVDGTLLGAVGVGMLVAPLAYGLTDRLHRCDYPVTPRGAGMLAATGVAAEAGALWLFRRSHADLGRNWTPFVEQRDEQTLVTVGVYRHIRHPMYASQFLAGIAQVCLLQNWIAGPLGVISFVPFYLRRVGREESMMRARFGSQWDTYAARTARVIPGRRWSS